MRPLLQVANPAFSVHGRREPVRFRVDLGTQGTLDSADWNVFMQLLLAEYYTATAARLVAALLAGLWTVAATADDIVIHNHRLHIECAGQGSPAVILDAGLGGSSLEWVYVIERLRPITRVCSFDRAGYGASDMGPIPRTSSRIANELYLLLDGAGVNAPYILVGHSFGGYNAALFARRFGYLTAGLVLIDASHPEQVERFLAPPLNILTAPSSRYGIVQFRDPPPPHSALPEPLKREIMRRAQRSKTRRTLASEMLSFRDSAQQLRRSPALRDMPLMVITRGKLDGKVDDKRILMEQLWLQMQTELAASSTASTHLIAHQAGHHVHIEQPELVAFAIAMLIERSRQASVSAAVRPPTQRSGYNDFTVTDAAWLSDTLKLYPAADERLAGCRDARSRRCAYGAP